MFWEGTPLLTLQQAFALSILDRLLTLDLKTFIFSTKQHKAVSVASPTFSKIFLDCNIKEDYRVLQGSGGGQK